MKYIAYLIWFIIEAFLITIVVMLVITNVFNVNIDTTWTYIILAVLFLVILGGQVEHTFYNLQKEEHEEFQLKKREIEIKEREIEIKERKINKRNQK